VRVYSLERITELDAGALGGSRSASMVGGEMSVDGPGPMKQADGPSHAAGHADRIINTFFDHKTRTPAELRERIGAERCAEIAAELPAIRARFVQLLARLSTVGDGSILDPQDRRLVRELAAAGAEARQGQRCRLLCKPAQITGVARDGARDGPVSLFMAAGCYSVLQAVTACYYNGQFVAVYSEGCFLHYKKARLHIRWPPARWHRTKYARKTTAVMAITAAASYSERRSCLRWTAAWPVRPISRRIVN
jgi:hypothetical protein